jgi:hypothetical protein
MNLPDKLVGKWIADPSGRVEVDETERQIWDAVQYRLKRLGHRESGWTTLYYDPAEDSFWELTFPVSGTHGAGPAQLMRITAERVRQLYPSVEVP